jgi:hypothetical protein
MKKNIYHTAKSFVSGLVMVFALAVTASYAQSVTTYNISEKMVVDAQKAWCNALVQINQTKEKGGDYKRVASDIIDAAYGYQWGAVLFKPTLTTGVQTFRMDKEGALAYFVGGNSKYKDDSGFALRGWQRCESKPKGVILSGDTAISMGNVHIWDKDGKETVVDKTWGYRIDEKGNLRIILHHSSLPYKPAK